MSAEEKRWLPEIMYEEDPGGVSHALPFILVPPGQTMPMTLLIWEHGDTGDIEPGPNGEELPIVNAELRQYGRMDILKERLSPMEYDRVRRALGLESLKTATEKGKALTDKVLDAY